MHRGSYCFIGEASSKCLLKRWECPGANPSLNVMVVDDRGLVRALKWDSNMFGFVRKSVRKLAVSWQVDGGRGGRCHSLKQFVQCQKKKLQKTNGIQRTWQLSD